VNDRRPFGNLRPSASRRRRRHRDMPVVSPLSTIGDSIASTVVQNSMVEVPGDRAYQRVPHASVWCS